MAKLKLGSELFFNLSSSLFLKLLAGLLQRHLAVIYFSKPQQAGPIIILDPRHELTQVPEEGKSSKKEPPTGDMYI